MSHLSMRLALIALLTFVGFAFPAVAAPVNDNFANATLISSPGRLAGDNTGSTAEPGEPGGVRDVGTVWWRFTPAVTGPYVIASRQSSFDTMLDIYTAARWLRWLCLLPTTTPGRARMSHPGCRSP